MAFGRGRGRSRRETLRKLLTGCDVFRLVVIILGVRRGCAKGDGEQDARKSENGEERKRVVIVVKER